MVAQDAEGHADDIFDSTPFKSTPFKNLTAEAGKLGALARLLQLVQPPRALARCENKPPIPELRLGRRRADAWLHAGSAEFSSSQGKGYGPREQGAGRRLVGGPQGKSRLQCRRQRVGQDGGGGQPRDPPDARACR
jgi:hypothetical protein